MKRSIQDQYGVVPDLLITKRILSQSHILIRFKSNFKMKVRYFRNGAGMKFLLGEHFSSSL